METIKIHSVLINIRLRIYTCKDTKQSTIIQVPRHTDNSYKAYFSKIYLAHEKSKQIQEKNKGLLMKSLVYVTRLGLEPKTPTLKV